MPGSAAAATRDAPVRAIVLSSVGGGSGGLVDGRGGRLGRPGDALDNVVVRPQLHLQSCIHAWILFRFVS